MTEVREAFFGDGTLKVTSDGRVLVKRPKNGFDTSEPKWREVCTKNAKDGYKSAWIHYEDGSKEIRRVHRLIAEAFLPNPFPGYFTEINHINGNKNDNNVENLEWCTHLTNMHEAVRTGLIPCRTRICRSCGAEYKPHRPRQSPYFLCEDCKREYLKKKQKATMSEQERLREDIKSRGIMQIDIVKVTGLDKSVVSRFMNGKAMMSIENLQVVRRELLESEGV